MSYIDTFHSTRGLATAPGVKDWWASARYCNGPNGFTLWDITKP